MDKLPVAVIGAGPVGLAAAAHLHAYQQPFIVLEAGAEPGAAVREWGHVRTFSPWRYMIDGAARNLLESTGWSSPDAEHLPTGNELIDEYVNPLANHPAIRPRVRYRARVEAVGRKDFDKVRTKGRDGQPFEIRLAGGETIDARAVIDASGTWQRPNPSGSGGIDAIGEREHRGRIAYGIPDVVGQERLRYAGKRILVVGSGHSAFNVILDLLALAEQAPETRIQWAMRRDTLESVWGGGASDALEARGELGQRARQAVESGLIDVLTPFRIRAIASRGNALQVSGAIRGDERFVEIDEVIVCTGFRPDLEMLREVRLGIDPWLECATALGPLIDPNEHSCGTVRPHGARELTHPEKDFYIVGMKSYGRAPTFLLATGYEQARSVVAMLSGDVAAAERVELVLPETGVCSTDLSAGAGGCCGGPAPEEADACCADDAVAKAEGQSGCGCGTPEPALLSASARPLSIELRRDRAEAASGREGGQIGVRIQGVSSSSESFSSQQAAVGRSMPARAVWAIGFSQLVNWGVLFFAFSVLLVPLQDAFTAPRWLIAGAFSFGLLVSATVSPAVGRLNDRGQGPAVMQAGGFLAAALLIMWVLVPTIWMTYAAWGALGLCMASILYEPVFAIVGRAFSDPEARLRAIATVTVTGGLASTVFLPGTSLLVTRFGWRSAVGILAAILAVSTLIIGRLAFRDVPWSARTIRAAITGGAASAHDTAPLHDIARLVAVFAISIALNAAIASNLVASLIDRGLTPAFAATVAGAFGIMQLPGRILLSNARVSPHPVPLLIASFAAQIAGLLALMVHGPVAMWTGVIVFAAGTGLTTLGRPYMVLHRYGPQRAGYANGVIARGQQIARAIGPVTAAALAGVTGYGAVFAVLAGLALLAIVLLAGAPRGPA